MPLRMGNLRSLARNKARSLEDNNGLCKAVLEQMLSALDYLACQGMCHRDVKPENILYWHNEDRCHFELADFGLANHCHLAVTKCGSSYYEAPELYPEYGKFAQSPKMDVWSLFATVADIHPKFTFPPRAAKPYDDVLRALCAAVETEPSLSAMVRLNPAYRASAAQMLVALFDGRGLSTPERRVPPIVAEPPAQPASASVPASQVPPPLVPAPQVPAPQVPASQVPAFQARLPAPTRAPPLVQYPRQPRRRERQGGGAEPSPALRPLGGGIVKSRAPGRPDRPAIPDRQAQKPAPALPKERFRPDEVPATKEAKDRETEGHPPDASLFSMPGNFPV